MKRICIFAHYDQNCLVDNYVLYFIKELNKVVDSIYFVSDCILPQEEINKITNYVDGVSAQRHKKYDFGSYQIGYNLIKEKLTKFDELIFCNDSCYGPFFNLTDIFEKMSVNSCDFWGMSACSKEKIGDKELPDFLESWFLVARKKVFISPEFENFMGSIKQFDSKSELILNCEVGFTQRMIKAGFKKFSVFNPRDKDLSCHKMWADRIMHGYPFIKISLIKDVPIRQPLGWEKIIKENSNYPIHLIHKHIRKIRNFNSYKRIFLSFIYNTLKCRFYF